MNEELQIKNEMRNIIFLVEREIARSQKIFDMIHYRFVVYVIILALILMLERNYIMHYCFGGCNFYFARKPNINSLYQIPFINKPEAKSFSIYNTYYISMHQYSHLKSRVHQFFSKSNISLFLFSSALIKILIKSIYVYNFHSPLYSVFVSQFLDCFRKIRFSSRADNGDSAERMARFTLLPGAIIHARIFKTRTKGARLE